MSAKYPNICVQLVGQDANAFSIMGRVISALRSGLREEGLSREEIQNEISEFQKECTSGDYDNLLCTVIKWVNCDSDYEEDYDNYDEY